MIFFQVSSTLPDVANVVNQQQVSVDFLVAIFCITILKMSAKNLSPV
jgi:hypothetical protein